MKVNEFIQSEYKSKCDYMTNPYTEGFGNLNKSLTFNFTPQTDGTAPLTLKRRAAHFTFGLLLFVPFVNTLTVLFLQKFATESISDPRAFNKTATAIRASIQTLNKMEKTSNLEGIFREQGSQDRLNSWRGFLKSAQEPTIHDITRLFSDEGTIYQDVAKFMSGSLNALPETPLTIDGDNLEAAKTSLKKLSEEKQELFRDLFLFLHTLSQKEETKMTANNLAICWGPTLFRTSTYEGAKRDNGLTQLMIENAPELFSEKEDAREIA